jgi:hypothetical protein
MPKTITEREKPHLRERLLSVFLLGMVVYLLVPSSPAMAASTEESAVNVFTTELRQQEADIASADARLQNEPRRAAADSPRLIPEPLPPTLPSPQSEPLSPPNYEPKPFAQKDIPDMPSPSQPAPAKPGLPQPPMPEPAQPGLPPPPMPQPAEPPALSQGPGTGSPPTTPEQKPTVPAPEPTRARIGYH